MKRSVNTRFRLNGRVMELDYPANMLMIDILREGGLTGTKVSCDQGVCGACTVLVDGLPTAACMTPLFMVNGKYIETIEALSASGQHLHPIQKAFMEESAFQCGFCTPGMIMLVKGMLDTDPDPDEGTISRWLSSNICRCTGYTVIFRAVERARQLLKQRAD